MRECEDDAGDSPVVPRSATSVAPSGSLFPSVPHMEHQWFCEKDVRRYECSCGLWQLRLERGDFVHYDASMCQVKHDSAGSTNLTHPAKVKLPAAVDNLDLFIRLLAEKTASLDMARFDRED